MAELHCHIEGTATPALLARQAARYGADLSPILRDGAYRWHDFTSFLAAYDGAAALFRDADDYALLAFEHFAGLAAAGAIHAEIFISPDHARKAGLHPDAYAEGLSAGLQQAREATGISAAMIVVGVRHFGAPAVEAAARFAAARRHEAIAGFGLAGDERVGRPADFAGAFDIARDAGLGLTAHAGEFAGPQAVRETLDALRPARIGHGVRAAEDGELLRRIAAEGIVLEICLHSNLALGLYPCAKAHPLGRLVAAGCRVTLNSDDPALFAASLCDDYALARDAHGLGAEALLGVTRTAVEAAFVGDGQRAQLLDRLSRAERALGADGAGR